MMRRILLASLLAVAVGAASADEYWIAYEGNDLPEDVGWKRVWGNEKGLFEGEGAHRWIEDGALVMDSLLDPNVWDFNKMVRPGEMDPEPGEVFVAEWRLLVSETRYSHDVWLAIASDEKNLVGFGYTTEEIEVFPDNTRIPISPGEWHTYRFLSRDMLNYELFVDERRVHTGSFWERTSNESEFAFGDTVQGAASLAKWDYVGFGVVPEPSAVMLAACAALRFRLTRKVRRRIENEKAS